MPLSRLIYSLLIPFIIFSAGMWLIYHHDLLPQIVIPVLVYLPFVSALILLLVAYQFNLYRLFTLTCLMLIWYYLSDFQSVDSVILSVSQQQLSMWLLPLILVIVSWLPERGIITIYGISGWLILALIITAGFYSSTYDVYKQLIGYRWQWLNDTPILTLCLLAAALLHQFFRLWRFDSVFDGVVFFILLYMSWYLLITSPSTLSLIIMHNLVQVLVIWGLIKHSHDMAYRDELTGLPGRRALNEWLKSPGRKYVIAMLDIDHFKKFNDRYGHDVGDDVLKVVASRLARVTGGGKAYRYGGEEFTIIFSGKDIHQCSPHLEAVREDIAHYKISLRENKLRPKSASQGRKKRGQGIAGTRISVTISIGVASKTSDRNVEEVIKAADKALYKAKKAGRNCLVADKTS